jgi:hypothetical protein
VGDDITYGQSSGYSGDSGDSRDTAYSVTRRVLEIPKKNVFIVGTQYQGNKPEKFVFDDRNIWLRDTNYGRLDIYTINGVRQSAFMKTAEYEALKEKADEKYAADYYRRQAADREKKLADWTLETADRLREIIQSFFRQKGRRMTNLATAKKRALIEIIKKYKILG